MLLWQINWKERASYAPGVSVMLDYSDSRTVEIMKECVRDILFEDEPVRIRDVGMPGMNKTIDLSERPAMNKDDRYKKRKF